MAKTAGIFRSLFHVLHRAIDEIYCMCELESSIHQCQEATRALDAFRIDFLKVRTDAFHSVWVALLIGSPCALVAIED